MFKLIIDTPTDSNVVLGEDLTIDNARAVLLDYIEHFDLHDLDARLVGELSGVTLTFDFRSEKFI